MSICKVSTRRVLHTVLKIQRSIGSITDATINTHIYTYIINGLHILEIGSLFRDFVTSVDVYFQP